MKKFVGLLIIALLGLPMTLIEIHRAQATITPAADYVVTDFATGFPNSNVCGQPGCGPLGVAFDTSGNLFVADWVNGGLYKFPPTGGDAPSHLVNIIAGNVSGLVFTKNGTLLGGRSADDDIVKIILPGGTTGPMVAKLPTMLYGGIGLAINPSTGDLFTDCCGAGGIYQVPIVTNPSGTITPFSNVFQPDGIGFDGNGVLYAANRQCGGGGVAEIDGINSATGDVHCLDTVPTVDGLAVSPKPGSPIVIGNGNDGIITRLDLAASKPRMVTASADVVTGGTRGDFATFGPDGCVYASQTDRVIKVANSAGKCPFGGFHNASENLSSCPAPCSSEPSIATAGSNVDEAWLNNTSGDSNILFTTSNNNGTSFGPIVKITNSTKESASNEQIAAAGSDVYVVWQQNISLTISNILFRASTDNATSFAPVLNLSAGASCGGGCTIITSSVPQAEAVGSNVYVVWLAGTTKGSYILFRASSNGGGSFGSTTILSKTAYASTEPQITAVANFVYVAWSDTSPGRPQTFFAASSKSGAMFGTAFALSVTPIGETDLYQKIATAGNSVYVTWTNETSLTDNTMFASSTNDGSSFAPALNLNIGMVTDLHPQVSASGTNVYVVWSETRGGNTEVLFKASTNNGSSFGMLMDLSNVPGTSNEQVIASSGSNVYVTWVASGTSNNGVYFALSTDGGSTFRPPSNLISDIVSSNPVVADPPGYADVAWEDGSTGNGDIYIVTGKPFSFDFSMSNSGAISLSSGSSGSTNITLSLVNGTTQSVSLSCSGGLPSGASCTFNPVNGQPSFSTTLTVSTQSSTAVGLYNITVTSKAGDLGFAESRSTQFLLFIKSVPATVSALFTSTGTRINVGAPTGTSVYDTANVTVNGATPTGNLTYTFYHNPSCTGTGVSQTVPLSNGNIPNSFSTGPLPDGAYSFQAVYNGDKNYVPSSSPCELLGIGLAAVGGTLSPIDGLGLLPQFVYFATSITITTVLAIALLTRLRHSRKDCNPRTFS